MQIGQTNRDHEGSTFRPQRGQRPCWMRASRHRFCLSHFGFDTTCTVNRSAR